MQAQIPYPPFSTTSHERPARDRIVDNGGIQETRTVVSEPAYLAESQPPQQSEDANHALIVHGIKQRQLIFDVGRRTENTIVCLGKMGLSVSILVLASKHGISGIPLIALAGVMTLFSIF